MEGLSFTKALRNALVRRTPVSSRISMGVACYRPGWRRLCSGTGFTNNKEEKESFNKVDMMHLIIRNKAGTNVLMSMKNGLAVRGDLFTDNYGIGW